MGTVMVRCPATGRAISTGIETDQSRFDRAPVFFAGTYCPICRTNHEWFARDAWVDELTPVIDAKAADASAHEPHAIAGPQSLKGSVL